MNKTVQQEQQTIDFKSLFPRVKGLYRYETNEGIIYSEQQQSNQLIKMNGFCRVHFKNNSILQGVFRNGKSQKVLYYKQQFKQRWIIAKWEKDKGVCGQGEEYDEIKQLVYFGQFDKYQRNGEGTQYFGIKLISTGKWKNGIKEGLFKQNINSIIKGEGKYQNDKKVGKWKFQTNNEQNQQNYGNQQNQQKEILNKSTKVNEQKKYIFDKNIIRIKSPEKYNTLQKTTKHYSNNFIITNHKSLLTEVSLQKLKKQYTMLDDSIISSWSMIMRNYLAYKGKDNVIVFSTDLIKYYAGLYLQQRKYQKIQSQTRHFSPNFNIFTFPQNNQNMKKKYILFPIIKSVHFFLVVVQITLIQQKLSFQCLIYDSLRSNSYYTNYSPNNIQNSRKYQSFPKYNNVYSTIKQFLIDQLTINLIEKYSHSQVLKQIQQMKLCYMPCPSQRDGVSCGVFLSLFMLYFCLGKQLPPTFFQSFIRQFRTQTLNTLLLSPKINIQDIEGII